MSLKVLKKGDRWVVKHYNVAHERMVICAKCEQPITWARGDFFMLADSEKLKCPHCGAPFKVGDLLP